MTLNVSATEILIKNATGQTKFTSNNKLIWEKYYRTGEIFVPFNKYNSAEYSVGLDSTLWASINGYQDNDFALITLIIRSSTGTPEVTNGIINKEIPANGSIIVDFKGFPENNVAAGFCQVLCVDVAESFLNFRVVAFDQGQNRGYGNIDLTIEYKLRIWSYL